MLLKNWSEKKIEINVNIIVESNKILCMNDDNIYWFNIKKNLLCIVNYIYVYLKKIYLLGRKY